MIAFVTRCNTAWDLAPLLPGAAARGRAGADRDHDEERAADQEELNASEYRPGAEGLVARGGEREAGQRDRDPQGEHPPVRRWLGRDEAPEAMGICCTAHRVRASAQ
jgi:hypothetical protein